MMDNGYVLLILGALFFLVVVVVGAFWAMQRGKSGWPANSRIGWMGAVKSGVAM